MKLRSSRVTFDAYMELPLITTEMSNGTELAKLVINIEPPRSDQ